MRTVAKLLAVCSRTIRRYTDESSLSGARPQPVMVRSDDVRRYIDRLERAPRPTGDGKPFTIHGLLVTTQGVPVADSPVDIPTAPANGIRQFTEATSATTAVSGAWTAKLPAPTRIW